MWRELSVNDHIIHAEEAPEVWRWRESRLFLAACRLLGRAARTVRLWQQVQRERRQLGELDERILTDIGLTRRQAFRESARPFWHTGRRRLARTSLRIAPTSAKQLEAISPNPVYSRPSLISGA